MKSLAMNKLFSKSSDADLPKINSLKLLEIIHKNVLYLTYQVDFINKKLAKMNLNMPSKLVEEFYDEDGTSDNNPASD